MKKPDTTARQSEQQFFADPAIDRLMGTVLALAQEHYVLVDQVRALNAALVRAGVVDATALDRQRDPADDAAARESATRFADALLRPLLGLQESRSFAAQVESRKNSHTSSTG